MVIEIVLAGGEPRNGEFLYNLRCKRTNKILHSDYGISEKEALEKITYKIFKSDDYQD